MNIELKENKRYTAICGGNALQAAVNGHSKVFPHATMRYYKRGWCVFYKGDKEVYSCNASYAKTHFQIIETTGTFAK